MRIALVLLALSIVPVTVAQTTHQVIVRNFEFVPATLDIEVGDTVEWTNEGGFHNVQERSEGSMPDGFGNDADGPGWTYSFTFDEIGDFLYLCGVHPASMLGEVSVSDGTAIGDERPIAADALLLSPPVPNPTVSSASFTLLSGVDARGEVAAYDLLGRRVAVLWTGRLTAGQRMQLSLDASAHGLPAGQYFVRAQAGSARSIRALVVVGR